MGQGTRRNSRSLVYSLEPLASGRGAVGYLFSKAPRTVVSRVSGEDPGAQRVSRRLTLSNASGKELMTSRMDLEERAFLDIFRELHHVGVFNWPDDGRKDRVEQVLHRHGKRA